MNVTEQMTTLGKRLDGIENRLDKMETRLDTLGTNQGLQKLHNKTMRGWKSETATMSKCVDEVWAVSSFTQEMREMNNGKLVNTVMRIRRRIW